MQTNSVYECSNEECQKEIDKQKAKRIQQLEEKAIADQKRVIKIQEKRKLAQKLETEQPH